MSYISVTLVVAEVVSLNTMAVTPPVWQIAVH